MEAVFQATYTFEQFVLEYAQYHLNKTKPNLSINSQEIGKGKKKKIIYYLQCRSVDFHIVIVLQKKDPKMFLCQKKKIKIKKSNKLH